MICLSPSPCPTAGFAQPAGYGGAERCSAKPCLRPKEMGDKGSAAKQPPGTLTQPPLGRPGGRPG